MSSKPAKLRRPWVPVATPVGIANRPRDDFYHTAAWKRAARMFIQDNPLCVKCQESGRLTPAIVTDHIIPKDKCTDPWDQNNWQPLCKQCHSVKSAKDKKHFK
jgi:5-methylcytosine-specific restriction endonuclease McrA